MSRATVVRVLVGALLLAGSLGAVAQQKSLYTVDEYNAFVDTTRGEPAERLTTIEAFLKNYPNSVLRALIYPAQAQLAFSVKQYEKAMGAVDAYLAMDREQVNAILIQSGYNELQIENTYYASSLTHSYSYLQLAATDSARAQALSENATRTARRGLELHERLYTQVQAPTDPEQLKQFEAQKRQAEGAFRTILADGAYRNKDFAGATQQYGVLIQMDPQNGQYAYRLAVSYLSQQPPQLKPALWWMARTVTLTPGEKEKSSLRETLMQNTASYEGLYDVTCAQSEVEAFLQQASSSPAMPSDWSVPSREDVQAVRQGLNVAQLMEGLKAGGEQERMTWLASCGLELPELETEVVQISQNEGNVVTLGVAVTQESSEAKKADMVVKVIAPPEAKNVKVGDFVHISGTLRSYQKDPEFQLVLSDGRIKPEDIPKTRGGRGGAR